MDLMEQVRAKAAANPQKVAFFEADDPKMMEVVGELTKDALCACYIVGEGEKLAAVAEQVGVDLTNVVVVDINDVACTILYPGTTLNAIAMQYDIPKDQLLEFNEVEVEEELKEGDIIFLDKKKKKYTGAKDFYYVKKDDTLYGVSQLFGIKVASLAKMNHREPGEKLYEGDKLRLK